jgi:hypothetical protein
MITEPQLKIKVGDFVKFKDSSFRVYGFVCRINSNGYVDYVRDNLTGWSAPLSTVQKGMLITENDFIKEVLLCAAESKHKIPSEDEIKAALDLFAADFDVPLEEVVLALNITEQ